MWWIFSFTVVWCSLIFILFLFHFFIYLQFCFHFFHLQSALMGYGTFRKFYALKLLCLLIFDFRTFVWIFLVILLNISIYAFPRNNELKTYNLYSIANISIFNENNNFRHFSPFHSTKENINWYISSERNFIWRILCSENPSIRMLFFTHCRNLNFILISFKSFFFYQKHATDVTRKQ